MDDVAGSLVVIRVLAQTYTLGAIGLAVVAYVALCRVAHQARFPLLARCFPVLILLDWKRTSIAGTSMKHASRSALAAFALWAASGVLAYGETLISH